MNNIPMQPPPEIDPLPHDELSERHLLGALLLDPETIWDIAALVSDKDFYFQKHVFVYQALAHVAERGTDTSNIIAVSNELKRAGHEIITGGFAFLSALIEETQGPAYAMTTARIVVDNATRRRVIKTATNALQDSYNAEKEIDDTIDAAMSSLQGFGVGGEIKSAADVSRQVIATAEHFYENRLEPGEVRGIDTGWESINRLTGGWGPGLYVLLGVPHSGKSYFCLHAAQNVAAAGGRALFFSLEMSAAQLLTRLCTSHARVTSMDYRAGNFSEAQLRKMQARQKEIEGWRLDFIDDTNSAGTIFSTVRQEMRGPNPPDLVVIDYFNLVEPSSGGKRRESANWEMIALSRGMKNLAQKTQCSLLTPIQVSAKAIAVRDNKRPQKSDAYGSSGPEQDSDVIFAIYQDSMYYQDANGKRQAGHGRNEHLMEIAKLKDRPNGGAGQFSNQVLVFTEHGALLDADARTLSDYQDYLNERRR